MMIDVGGIAAFTLLMLLTFFSGCLQVEVSKKKQIAKHMLTK
ncbi:hypothetical protein DFQ01_1544 [Paenibacillus cellulosilyticus]|uniref:Uncharacterized protein n=1 Tax=Paenibacillus cellulosilyticus TaxID=375489 RepID=A0A2V2YAP5_9BACL|nr:hypothetical protein DFQ01_1544 [Paenibacillus cellulosilyticus]